MGDVSDSDIHAMMSMLDLDCNGFVDASEFCSAFSTHGASGRMGLSQPDVPALPGNPHEFIDPSKWCVSAEQLKDLLNQVNVRFPDSDPNAYAVVEKLIKPATKNAGVSYALMLNPEGMKAKYFFTHAWAESFKNFCCAVLDLVLDGGLWICFLANPQTWPSDQLDNLLGQNPFSSPFALALRAADQMIAVRNVYTNLYERLWCVFELYLSIENDKPIKVVGQMPLHIDLSKCGSRAVCSNDKDTRKLRAAISGHEDKIDERVGMIMMKH